METLRKTKIICTLGPATDEPEILEQLMKCGMNAARFNFSHGTHQEQKKRFDAVVKMREELGLPIATVLDTKGPEIRIGTFENGGIDLVEGQTFTLVTGPMEGNQERVSLSYQALPRDLNEGDTVLIDDGLIEMVVTSVTPTDIVCKVLNGGHISDRKGVNVPNVTLSMPYLNEKDFADISFGVQLGFDYIAASFVRSADDVKAIRTVLSMQGCDNMKIIAKIENRQGVDNIDEIIEASDGIMVARGDMGVEIPFEEVPAIQKMIINKVYNAGKQVVTATQMLDSMMHNPRPTRAEAADVANAVYDGTSAIMLSGETAAGKYPVEALKAMVRIAETTEKNIDYDKAFKKRETEENPDIANAIAHATCTTAMDLNAKAIMALTGSGFTARMISKYRPECNIIGCSAYDEVLRHMNLSWGVTPIKVAYTETEEEQASAAVEAAIKAGYIEEGDIVTMTAGLSIGSKNSTNLIRIKTI